MRTQFILVFIFTMFASCHPELKTNQSTGKKFINNDFQNILDSSKVKGTILIFDFNNKTYYSNDFSEAAKSAIPASTFKIPNSIIGLETGLLNNEQSIFKWRGDKRAFTMWERDLTLKDAFQKSCVPCYQELAKSIGVKRMHKYLAELNFGQMIVTAKTIDNFWLTGQSGINPFQQIDFLVRLYNNKLKISKSTHATLINILKIKEYTHFTLSGKTGLGGTS